MSFFCNFQSDKCPGQITGNPLNGLCEKVCIEVKKVFDACMQQSQLNGVVLNITDLTPANPTYPLTFVSARSTASKGVISNLLVEPLPERENAARVKADITIPVSVAYTDANGVEGVVSTQGTYTGENQFTVDCCVSIILKIVMEVELLVPSYGYAQIPPCQEYTQEVCAGFFELPMYPN